VIFSIPGKPGGEPRVLQIDESWYVKPEGIPERTSAGGVVTRVRDGRVYIALTREKGLSAYVIPKGGVEPGETLLEAALREIREEAGLSALRLITKLGVRERLDVHKERWIVAHYFLFVTDRDFEEPADRANHYDPGWFPLDDLPELFWPEQRELLEMNREKIRRLVAPPPRPSKRGSGIERKE
jgi:8-oxo-dGTP pyrophosphatase MutT (NUDIX family)